MRIASAVFLLVVTLTSLPVTRATSAAPEFDLLITNGRIVDGTGNPWMLADLAIKDGRVAALGKIDPARAARTLDAKGLIVAPGFIDVHTHIEGAINRLPQAENFLRMGVTSVVTGNCGSSELNLSDWFEQLEKLGISLNVATLYGHNTVRHAGMDGDFNRPPTPDELNKMRNLVEQAMRAGAVGFSTGLEYVPGTYAKTDEIAELAKVAASYGGVYASHMRDEGVRVEAAINETLEIGRLTGCPVEISHFKISSKNRWGASAITTKLVADARARGQQVTVDQYMYPASSTGIGIVFPSWVFEGGRDETRIRLEDSATRTQVKKEILAKAAEQGFADLSFVYIANHQADQTINGKNLAEIAKLKRNSAAADAQAEQAIDLQLAGGAQVVLQKMSEQDIEKIFKQPFTMIASDAGVQDINSNSIPHPRGFGNNARVLAVYVRDKQYVSLEEAIRKMASLPAQTFHLWDRGVLRPGLAADVVIFDEKSVKDNATFQQPKQFATGFEYVIVNGQVVIEQGRHTGAKAGKILRGAGAKE
ncbi:MAG: D-aminoacylase [Acidobacteria bacterium]|nr:D-aminoacylase [Acidobacteriota bacterium]MBI3424631.1 D-aminoacylase [Acidobacteriota bacterium]